MNPAPPHIRQRVPRTRPRPGYLRNPGQAATLCAAPATVWDLSYADAVQAADWPACPDCRLALRQETTPSEHVR